MAIVKSGRASNGARYHIDDSCAARPGTAEYSRRAAEQCRIAHQILVQAAKDGKKMEVKHEHERA